MARRGLFSRLRDVLRAVGDALEDFLGTPEAPTPPEPPSPPEPPTGGGGGGGFDSDYDIWRRHAVGSDKIDYGLYNEWRELYENATAPLQLDPDDNQRFWSEFLRAFYLTRGERQSLSRDQFYRNIGVRKRDFEMDWQEWREIKRGTP